MTRSDSSAKLAATLIAAEARRAAGAASRKPRVIVVAHTGFVAHAGRARLLSDELQSHGIEVLAAGDRLQPHWRLLGQRQFVDAPLIDREWIMSCAQERVSWGFYDEPTLGRHVEAWTRALGSVRPLDAVVTDFALPALIAAECLRIPSISIQNLLWTSHYRRALSAPENHWMVRALGAVRLGRFAREASGTLRITNGVYGVLQRRWAAPFNTVRRRLGLPRRSTFFRHSEGDLVLVADLEDLCARWMRLPHERIRPVGPLVWEPPAPELEEPESETFRRFLRDGGPFVYVSFGSSGTRELFQLVIDAFRDVQAAEGMRVAITTGGQFENWDGWRALPPHICRCRFFPGGEALRMEGCRAVINHGGSGTVYQALAAAPGIPMLMIPTHADQQWNAEMIQELGFGQLAFASELTAIGLRRRVLGLARSKGH